MSSEVKLSGEFQPNVYFDFVQGKVYSNRWAQGFVEFPFHTKEEDKPLYIYAENEYGEMYNTGYACPRFVACISHSNNIKISTSMEISIDTDEEIGYGGIWDGFAGEYIEELKNAGINYYTKTPQSVDDLLQDITVRPSIVFMPQVRPIVKGGKKYVDTVDVADGELFVISVLPSYEEKSVLLCSDKRLFVPESFFELDGDDWVLNPYRFQPDENVTYYENDVKVDNIDDYSAKFRVNGEFVSTIFLSTGSIICLRAVVDTLDINGVDTKVTYWEVDNSISLMEMNNGGGYIDFVFGEDSYERVELPMPSYCSSNLGGSIDMYIEVNTKDNDGFENSIIVIDYDL